MPKGFHIKLLINQNKTDIKIKQRCNDAGVTVSDNLKQEDGKMFAISAFQLFLMIWANMKQLGNS